MLSKQLPWAPACKKRTITVTVVLALFTSVFLALYVHFHVFPHLLTGNDQAALQSDAPRAASPSITATIPRRENQETSDITDYNTPQPAFVESSSDSNRTLEIRLVEDALRTEGLGAVLSGLKPVLLLAHTTGAVITARNIDSGSHGYKLRKYLRLKDPLKGARITCNLSESMTAGLLSRIVAECERFDYTIIAAYGVFTNCDTLIVRRYLLHPRTCVAHTAALARAFSRLHPRKERERSVDRTDVCILRRGGDVERRIVNGLGNMWAIDEARTLPLLKRMRKRGRRIVLVTETTREALVLARYRPDILSNSDHLRVVVRILTRCRCMFVSAGSSFAATMVQLTQPKYVVYTVSRPGFSFNVTPYNYSEFGRQALSIIEQPDRILTKCAPTDSGGETRPITIDV